MQTKEEQNVSLTLWIKNDKNNSCPSDVQCICQLLFTLPLRCFSTFTLQTHQALSEKSLTLKRGTDGVEALNHLQGATATVIQVRLRWPQWWMQSDTRQFDLILHKQMSHFVLNMEQGSSLLGPSVRVNDLYGRGNVTIERVVPTQLNESIISVNTASKPKLPSVFGWKVNGWT